MNTILISYDLNVPGRNYSLISDKIKSFGNWARPLESVWIIKTFSSPVEVRDSIRTAMDLNDSILVIDITKKMWGSYNISSEVTNWMQREI